MSNLKFMAGTKIQIGALVFLETDNKLYPYRPPTDSKRVGFYAKKDYSKGDVIEFDPSKLMDSTP